MKKTFRSLGTNVTYSVYAVNSPKPNPDPKPEPLDDSEFY